jgi:hypothetical protein
MADSQSTVRCFKRSSSGRGRALTGHAHRFGGAFEVDGPIRERLGPAARSQLVFVATGKLDEIPFTVAHSVAYSLPNVPANPLADSLHHNKVESILSPLPAEQGPKPRSRTHNKAERANNMHFSD